jgi:hypothetical protein
MKTSLTSEQEERRSRKRIYCYDFRVPIYGFGLVIGFNLHVYNSLLYFTNHYHTQTSALSLLQSPLAVAWYRLPAADVPLPLGARNIPGLSYQILTATEPQRLSNSQTNWLHSTDWLNPRLVLIITSRHGSHRTDELSSHYCWLSLYRLGSDLTKTRVMCQNACLSVRYRALGMTRTI